MAFTLINMVMEKPVNTGETMVFNYAEGKERSHYYGAINHNVAFDNGFFKSPRDFSVFFDAHQFTLHWHTERGIPAGTLVNIQIEEPGGDFFSEPKHGVTVNNLVRSQIFTMNLGTPKAVNPAYFTDNATIAGQTPLPLSIHTLDVPRNITLSSEDDCSAVTFRITGKDIYDNPMCEDIRGPQAKRFAVGNKSFAEVTQIIASDSCSGTVSAGVGDKLGMPAFLPGSGFLLRQLVNGKNVTGGIIIPGLTEQPTATTTDVRGLYTPPTDIKLDGSQNIQLVVSLFNPSHIGMRDFVG